MSIRDNQAKKAATISLDDDDADTTSSNSTTTHNTEPRTAPGQLMTLQGKYLSATEEIKGLEKRLAGFTFEIPLGELHEIEGRRRKLTAQQFHDLIDNLRNNPLVNPIVVRKRAKLGYEIISGHNRVAAYTELGYSNIQAVILDSSDDQADINAFYANLIQPDLPDFEKYRGFKMLMQKYPDLKSDEIAGRAGVSPRLITLLLSFGGLPAEAIKILEANPETIGATAAENFAKLVKKGRGAQVVQAIQKIANKELDQAQGVRFAGIDSTTKPVALKPEPIAIKVGKRTYCKMQRAETVLRLQFVSAEEAQAAEKAVREVLESRAKELKLGKNSDGESPLV